MKVDAFHYSIHIQWSKRNQAFLVTVPELPGCKTHGETYDEAVKNAREVIQLWLVDAHAHHETLPPPDVLA